MHTDLYQFRSFGPNLERLSLHVCCVPGHNLVLCRRQSHLGPVLAGQGERESLHEWPVIPTLNTLEIPNNLRHCIASLGDGELLPGTNPRPAIERNVSPSGLQGGPSLRTILSCVGSEYLWQPMHAVYAVKDLVALGNEDGILALGAAAKRKISVPRRRPTVHWHDRI